MELSISLSASEEVLGRLAKAERRLRLSRKSCSLNVATESPSTAIAEARKFAERVRKATKSERV